jgi:hypothetical protein
MMSQFIDFTAEFTSSEDKDFAVPSLDFSRNSVAGALIYAKVPVLQGIMGLLKVP